MPDSPIVDDLDELFPGDQVRDVDGDVWQRTRTGRWTCLTQSNLRQRESDDLLEKYGPLRIEASSA